MINDEYCNNDESRGRLSREFIDVIANREREINPSGQEDWKTIAKGFALAKGLSPECAQAFGTYVMHYYTGD